MIDESDPITESAESQQRDSKLGLFLAGCLSSIVPGAGHLLRKLSTQAVFWFVLFTIALVGTLATRPWRNEVSLQIAVWLGTALFCASGVDAAFVRTKQAQRVTKWSALLFALLAFVASIYINQWTWRLDGYRVFEVPSTGMQPTIAKGERIVANLHAYHGATPGRGDVIIFQNPGDSTPFVKRVVALPGDTIEGKEGEIFLNGRIPEEPYISPMTPDKIFTQDETATKQATFGPVKLGPDEYFVMGDNRPHSLDSRITGPVKLMSIRGKALYIIDRKAKDHDGKRLD